MNAAAAPHPPDPGNPPVNKFQVEQALYVSLFGALGGLLFWVMEKYGGNVPKQIAGWPWYGQVASLLFLGGMAALFGVYLLIGSPLNAIRTYILAILCGLVWQPVISAAVSSVSSRSAILQAGNVMSQTEQLKSALDRGNAQQVNSAVASTVPAVTTAIGQLADVEDAAKKQAILDSSKKAITLLENASLQLSDKADSGKTIQGIQKVGMAAGRANQTGLGVQAVQSISAIGLHAQQLGVANLSLESIKHIEESSTDPVVKRAAQISLQDLQSRTASFVH